MCELWMLEHMLDNEDHLSRQHNDEYLQDKTEPEKWSLQSNWPLVCIEDTRCHWIIEEDDKEHVSNTDGLEDAHEPCVVSAFVEHHDMVSYDVCEKHADTGVPVVVNVTV